MRASRLLPTLTALLGAGLLSGSLAQVAAMDRQLARAVQERDPIERMFIGTEAARPEVRPCDRERRNGVERSRWRAS